MLVGKNFVCAYHKKGAYWITAFEAASSYIAA
jgi:hypothetical protein